MPSERIAIIKLSSIGDCVLASPVPASLKKFNPGREITWVVEQRCKDIVECNPFVDEVLALENASFASLLRAGRELRRRRFDTVLDLQGILKSSILTAMSGAKKRVAGGYARGIARCVANQIADGAVGGLHATQLYLRCAGAIGCDESEVRLVAPIDDADRRFADEFLSAHHSPFTNPQSPLTTHHPPLVGINPCASRSDKRWPPERFAEVADALIEQDRVHVIAFGGTGDRGIVDAMKRAMRHDVLDATGRTTLRQLAALAERCVVFITNDSGPMHIAAAVGTRVIGIFGASNPGLTAPYGQGHVVFWKARSWEDAKHRGARLLAAVTGDEVIGACRSKLSERLETCRA